MDEPPPDDAADRAARAPAPERYARESPGLEFDRVAFFSDAVFAIAMTLLVVGIGIPQVRDAELGDALRDKGSEITSFFVSFVVIGAYWRAHHRLFHRLTGVSPRLINANLVFLAAIAFVPFPTALAGRYSSEPESIVIYAITLAVASGILAVISVIAQRDDLFRTRLTPEASRFALVASGIPVVVFLGSIPLALVDTRFALWSWLLIIPLEVVADRWLKPEGADELFR